MKLSINLSVICIAASAAAHGIVCDMKVGGEFYTGYLVFQDPYKVPVPERIVWAFPQAGNGPVGDISSAAIACNTGATPAKLSAPVEAGAEVSFFWTAWPESHRGPAMTYMANCGGDCSTVDATTLSFFKIHEAGLNPDGSWASDTLIANNNTWTVTIPSDIAPGQYVIRHEFLALHSAGNSGGAQFYPMCANLEVKGSGSANPAGVKFPGAYTASDPGILINIYQKLASYVIPGPAVYRAGSGSPDGQVPSAKPSAKPTSTSRESGGAAPVSPTLSDPTPVPTACGGSTSTKSTELPPPRTPVSRTTLSTVTRPPSATTTDRPASTLASGCLPDSVSYNKCLDKANACLAEANRGYATVAECEVQRKSCKQC